MKIEKSRSMFTEKDAKSKNCCVDLSRKCTGSTCMGWRWTPLRCDEEWRNAVAAAAKDIRDTSPNRAKAAAHVNANRDMYGLETESPFGFCGRAGELIA